MQSQLIPEFDNFFKIAGSIAASVFGFLLALSWFFPSLNGPTAILLTGVVFLGIPHGALDIFLISRLTYSDKEKKKLLGIYVTCLFPMVLAWWLVPEGAFLFFVLFSAYHFAQSDMISKEKNLVEFVTRFFIIFSLPFTFYTEKFSQVALRVLEVRIFDAFIPVFYLGTIIATVGMLVLIGHYIEKLLKNKVEFSTHFLEIPVIYLLFYFFEPLYAFGVYFCFIHLS